VKAPEGLPRWTATNDGGSMQPVVRGVGNQDIEALAQYIANLN
jgi:cytochrome c553